MTNTLKFTDKKPKVIPSDHRDPINRFGITRIHEPEGWWIRLGWYRENGFRKVQFQKVVRDSDFDNDPKISIKKAVEIRDLELKFIKKPDRPPNVINPIVRLGLCKDGNCYSWKFRKKTFCFWKTGKIYEAFKNAAQYAFDDGMEVDFDMLGEYFEFYIGKVKDKAFRNFINNYAVY